MMDLEQLKLILETISTMGGDAKEFGIWWLIATTLPSLIVNLLWCGFCILVLALAYRTIQHLIRVSAAANKVAEAIGKPVMGTWDHTDEARVLNHIRYLIKVEQEHTA
jgi:hypothetical protein